MIRKSAWAVIFLMLAVAASPVTAFGIPAGASMMPMHGGSGSAGGSSAGCNCKMPMQATAAMTRGENLPRAAGGPEPSPCNGSTSPVNSGISTTAGRVSGIRRIYPKNVLDHPERAAVYTVIVARPGIDLAGISSELGMNRETLRYHLDQLESATKVVVMRDHGIVRYYENHGRYTLLERKVLQHLWNPTAERILSFISSRPGITQAEVAVHLAVTAPTVRWYMQRFREDGLITEQHEGRYTRYTLNPEVSPFIRKMETGTSGAIATV
ncbi:MAG: winged helix-turn-helix transcriptional regulator [Methanoregula sp.]